MSGQAAAQEKGWYLRIDNVLRGPYSSARVRRLLLNGELTLADEVSMDRNSWRKLLEIPEVVPVKLRAKLGDRTAQGLVHARQLVEQETGVGRTQSFPIIQLVSVILMLVMVIGMAIWKGLPDQTDAPNCGAQAAPGVNWRNCVLNGLDVGAASLAGANLNSAILRQAKLMATNLTESDLRYADLRSADLSYAQLQLAAMQGANLQDADLSQADLAGADLRFANLTGSRLNGANLTASRLGEAIWADGKVCLVDSVGTCLH